MTVTTRGGRLRGLAFPGSAAPTPTDRSAPEWVADPMRRYFAGELDALADIDVDLGGTPFQHAVWSALRSIDPGTTVSYRDVAESVGRPTSSRAVGNAVGGNPIAIVVPCHRVITSGGGLGGFGGGLDRKRWLLAHEGAPVQVSGR